MPKSTVISHLITAVLSVAVSVGINSYMSKEIVQVDPKRLIDTYQSELNKSSLSVNEQSNRLVGFVQVLERTMNSYADENNVVVLVGAAVASNQSDVTNDIAAQIVAFYKSQSPKGEGEK
ncbi:TrbI F-type domain-containing protein [Vibrio sonorensis]|uniref:TrbI F-type domain-containing protein n=1 Tax=Vibrio sonorensis TaxID=1004316 RepID=UPI0008D92458|nr:TrbI F-type domain-containing protein [Vibrio sonorensis]